MTPTRTKRMASSWRILCAFLANMVLEKNKDITYSVHSRDILHTQSLHTTYTFFRGASCAHLELICSWCILCSSLAEPRVDQGPYHCQQKCIHKHECIQSLHII